MTHVLAVSAGRASAPSFRVRLVLAREELSRHGVVLDPVSLLPTLPPSGKRLARVEELLRARRRLARTLEASRSSVVMINRQADLLPMLGMERKGIQGRRFVYDVDDAIWFDGSKAGGHPLAFVKGSRRKARWLAARADHVIAGNEILAEWLAHYASEVSVVPSLVDTDAAPQSVRSDREELVVGWIGSRTTAPYLARLGHALEVAAKATAMPIRFVVIGVAPPVRGVQVVQEPWSPDAQATALRETHEESCLCPITNGLVASAPIRRSNTWRQGSRSLRTTWG